MSEYVNNELLNRTNILLPENTVRFEKRKSKPIGKLNTIFFLLLFAGTVIGAYYCVTHDRELYKELDFLFSSNIKHKLSQSLWQTFLSSYAGACVFVIATYFLGCSMWGMALLPLVTLFKGFGIGLTAAYLFTGYALNGAVYYIGVLLPGALLSAVALIILQSDAFRFCASMLRHIVYPDGKNRENLTDHFKKYTKRLVTALIITLVSSVADVGLTVIFGNVFNF